MEGLNLLASALALAFATTSAYLWLERGVEREQRRAAEGRVTSLTTRLAALERQRIEQREPEPAESPRAVSPSPQPAEAAVNPSGATDSGAERVVRLSERKLFANASGEALIRARMLADMRLQNHGMAERLNLTDDEAQKLLELLVNEQLTRRAQFAQRSSLGPADLDEAQARERKAIAALIGEERAKKYQDDIKGAPDRRQVRALRSRLGELDALTDDQATSLASALREEREQFARELTDQFGGRAGFTMSSVSGAVFMTSGGAADEDGQEKQIVDQMQRYNQRMLDRAATVLTARQVKVLAELQDAEFAQQRVFLRSRRETPPAK